MEKCTRTCNVSDPELEGVFDEMLERMQAPGHREAMDAAFHATSHSDIVRQLDKEDCPECVGTGNFYGNDIDGDFLPCDACDGTGFKM